EMRTEAEFVHGMAKRQRTTEFACFVRNVTPQAVKLEVPLGIVDRLPALSSRAYDRLIDMTRATYAAPIAEIDAIDRAFRAPKRALPPPPARRRGVTEPPAENSVAAMESMAPPATPSAPVFPDSIEPHPPVASALIAPARQSQARREPALLGKGGKEHKYI